MNVHTYLFFPRSTFDFAKNAKSSIPFTRSILITRDEVLGTRKNQITKYLVPRYYIYMKTPALTLLFLAVIHLPVDAGEIQQAHVDYDDGHYLVKFIMKIEAKLDTVYDILTDFDNLNRLNKSIKYSRLIKSRGNKHLVRLKVEDCVWIFCQEIIQTQWIPEQGRGYLSGVTLPQLSNLEYGRVLWHIQQLGEFTLISFHTDIVPAFFVPPLIGPYILKKKMLKKAEETIQTIERLAQEEEND